jgi:hypothetical protein
LILHGFRPKTASTFDLSADRPAAPILTDTWQYSQDFGAIMAEMMGHQCFGYRLLSIVGLNFTGI